MKMTGLPANSSRLMLVLATIVAVGFAPLATFGLDADTADDGHCMLKVQPDVSPGSADGEALKRCCPSKSGKTDTESVQERPQPAQGEGVPCDGQCGCQCCFVAPSAPAALHLTAVSLTEPPAQRVGTTIESCVPFLWADSLLRPPQF